MIYRPTRQVNRPSEYLNLKVFLKAFGVVRWTSFKSFLFPNFWSLLFAQDSPPNCARLALLVHRKIRKIVEFI